MKILNATVKFPAGKVFDGKFGKTQNAKAILDNGTEVTIWCRADEHHEIKKWRKGEKVQILEENGKYKAIETDRPFEDTPLEKKQMDEIIKQGQLEQMKYQAAMIEPPRQQKQMIAKYVEFQKKLYHFIFNQVSDEMQDVGLKDETLKDIATTLFIQTNKKFML